MLSFIIAFLLFLAPAAPAPLSISTATPPPDVPVGAIVTISAAVFRDEQPLATVALTVTNDLPIQRIEIQPGSCEIKNTIATCTSTASDEQRIALWITETIPAEAQGRILRTTVEATATGMYVAQTVRVRVRAPVVWRLFIPLAAVTIK